ncbi:nuclear transport factor 2 family protein [Simiduia sp. 21SJ11W-1]|uniref:nuclear transport factor 2 family protein n=1 Tax=Simiduia sp. 21SJ11W-1 TaxID=2909669 RepID=UPI0020A0E011|nr:nuclear transport factor 2 family protein [Simiduia sp. 21SJ11W-1]UTA47054.1 nuclear transport factor 2 family protein [Simiduia sp. 21SJ11W-1]
MKFLLALAATLCFITQSQADERDLLRASLDAFLAGAATDVAQHQRFWADDLIYTSSGGERFGKATIIEGMQASSAPATVRYWAEDVEIKLYGNAAVVAFRLMSEPLIEQQIQHQAQEQAPTQGQDAKHQEATANRAAGAYGQQYLNTGTFIKRNGEWAVVAWQATKTASSTGR